MHINHYIFMFKMNNTKILNNKYFPVPWNIKKNEIFYHIKHLKQQGSNYVTHTLCSHIPRKLCISHSPLKRQHTLLPVVSKHSTRRRYRIWRAYVLFRTLPTLLRKSYMTCFRVCLIKIITPWVDSEAWGFGEDMTASIQGNVLNGLSDMSFE